MHVMTKVTLGIGGVLLLISAAVLAIGGASASDTMGWDDVTGDEYWTGETSTSFSEKLNWDAYYLVYVEEGYEVDIEIYEGSNGGWADFEPCELVYDCDEELYTIPGYDYIGTIYVEYSGDFKIDFTENEGRSVDVMLREEKIPVISLMGAFGGFCGLCCSLFLLIIGGIMAFTLKDKPKVQTRIQIDNETVVIQENPDESLYDQDEST